MAALTLETAGGKVALARLCGGAIPG